jgi:hypothetical protein
MSYGKSPQVLKSGNASGVGTLDIDLSPFYNVYDTFEILLYNLYPATDNSDIWIRVSTDASSYDSAASNYSWAESYVYDTGGAGGGGSTGDTKGVLQAGVGNGAANAGTASIRMSGLASATYKPMLLCLSAFAKYAGFGGNMVNNQVSVKRLNAQITKAIRIMASSGNINADYIVYGCLK